MSNSIIPDQYKKNGTEHLGRWYHEQVKSNLELKLKVVADSPELAARLFSLTQDKEIGAAFIARYTNDQQYNSTAYFIGQDLGIEVGRLASSLRDYAEKYEFKEPSWIAEEIMKNETKERNKPPIGSGTPYNIGNYWMENQWDDIIRAREEAA